MLVDHSPPGGGLSESPAPRRADADERMRGAEDPMAHARAPLHGRYRLRERLGAGGFGVVWRAEDLQLHREVALKRIAHAGAWDGADAGVDARERARREALAAARLSHPAIVALYEAFVDEDAVYLVSELVHGDTLADALDAGALSDRALLEVGAALAQALAHAHARGVVHRDVKPHNVLIPRDPGPHEAPAKLTDFGGAHMAGEAALTRTGDTLGTLAYMAPEQSEGRDAGPAADVYSLALVLYEGLTGANPVRGPNPAATARRIGRPLPPLAAARADLPEDLAGAIDVALRADPARRGTLDELHDALTRSCAATERAFSAPQVTRHHDPRQDRYEDQQSRRGYGRERPRTLSLPRALWLGAALAGAIWLALSGLPGAALLLLAALAAPLLALGPRPPAVWLTAALAPLLGLAGLAGVYPALAGQARRWRVRAMLGALGYWWLILATPLLVSAAGRSGSRLWLDPAPGTPPRSVWEGSLTSAAAHVVGPAFATGVLLGAVLWALAAVSLPWVVRGRGALLDALAAIAWAAALLAVTPYLDGGLRALSGAASPAEPRGLVIGAILAAGVAVAARALRGPVAPAHP